MSVEDDLVLVFCKIDSASFACNRSEEPSLDDIMKTLKEEGRGVHATKIPSFKIDKYKSIQHMPVSQYDI